MESAHSCHFYSDGLFVDSHRPRLLVGKLSISTRLEYSPPFRGGCGALRSATKKIMKIRKRTKSLSALLFIMPFVGLCIWLFVFSLLDARFASASKVGKEVQNQEVGRAGKPLESWLNEAGILKPDG